MVGTQFGVLKNKVMRLRFNFMTEYHRTLASQLGSIEGVQTFTPLKWFLSDLPWRKIDRQQQPKPFEVLVAIQDATSLGVARQ